MNQAELQKLIVAWKQCCAAQNALLTDRNNNLDDIEDAIDELDDQLDDVIDALEDWAADYSATYTNFLCELYDSSLTTTTTTTAALTTTTTTTAALTTTTSTTYNPTLMEWQIVFENYLCQQENNPYVTTLAPPIPIPEYSAEYYSFRCAMENNPDITTTTTTVNPALTTTTSTTVAPGDINFSAIYVQHLCQMTDDPLAVTTTTTTIVGIDEDAYVYTITFENYICQQADVTTTTTTLVTTTTTTPEVTTTTTTISTACGLLQTGITKYAVPYHINIGTEINREVVLTVAPISVPDKFVVIHAGVEVINTSYRGDTDYQTILNTELTALSEPIESILDKTVTRFSFIKTSASPIATVYVYAPIEETEWSFVLSCPVVTTTTTTLADFYVGEYTDFACAMIDDGSPTTTTTTAPVTTTTTTPAPVPVETISCGEDWHSGENVYPYLYVVIGLGTGVGWVELSINTFDVPDKFIVEFNGIEVINTGYRGNLALQNELNAALAAYGDSPESIQDPDVFKFYFYKTGSTANAIVKVYAPIEESKWEFRLRCPDGATTTTTTTIAPTTTTSTTTQAPVTTTTTTNALPVSTDGSEDNARTSCSQAITLTPADFPYTDSEGDTLEYVKITGFALAGAGTLKYNGIDVDVDQIIQVYGGATGSFLYNLIYTPDASLNDAYSDYIDFKVRTANNTEYN